MKNVLFGLALLAVTVSYANASNDTPESAMSHQSINQSLIRSGTGFLTLYNPKTITGPAKFYVVSTSGSKTQFPITTVSFTGHLWRLRGKIAVQNNNEFALLLHGETSSITTDASNLWLCQSPGSHQATPCLEVISATTHAF